MPLCVVKGRPTLLGDPEAKEQRRAEEAIAPIYEIRVAFPNLYSRALIARRNERTRSGWPTGAQARHTTDDCSAPTTRSAGPRSAELAAPTCPSARRCSAVARRLDTPTPYGYTAVMGIQVFKVAGMSCGHCVHAVTAEFSKLPGVRSVDVDLTSGAVTVAADRELAQAEVEAAVDEAGYELAHDAGAT